jgi:hypothetical protein
MSPAPVEGGRAPVGCVPSGHAEGRRGILANTTPVGPGTSGSGVEEHEAHPRGTLFLMLMFLILIVAMWGYIYLMMLGRG